MRPLILDLDGVLRRWPGGDHGLPPGALARVAFRDPELLQRAVTGGLTDEEWRAEVARRLDERFPGQGAAAVASWSAGAGEVDAEVLALVREERAAGRRVVLLTNATTRLDADLARLRLGGEVDAVFNTSTLGVAKPDPAVFLQVAAALGVEPGECFLVDDSLANVEAAAALGMDAHHFTGVDGLARWLRSARTRPEATGHPS